MFEITGGPKARSQIGGVRWASPSGVTPASTSRHADQQEGLPVLKYISGKHLSNSVSAYKIESTSTVTTVFILPMAWVVTVNTAKV